LQVARYHLHHLRFTLLAHGLWGDGEASDPVNMYEEVVNRRDLTGRVAFPAGHAPEMISAIDLAHGLCSYRRRTSVARSRGPQRHVSLATGVPLLKKQP
jgi:hypothetical protein